MPWHKWTEDRGDEWEEVFYAYVPDDTSRPLAEDWPEASCGPEYWMHMIAHELELSLEEDEQDEEKDF